MKGEAELIPLLLSAERPPGDWLLIAYVCPLTVTGRYPNALIV